MGLLDDLRRQANTINEQLQDEEAIRAERIRRVDSCMAQIYNYLVDLGKNLDVIKPTSAQRLEFAPSVVFADMKVSDFFVDSRKTRHLERDVFNDIVFAFNYRGTQQFMVKKELPLEIDRLSDQLKQLGIRFERDDIKNERRLLSHSNFKLHADIRAGAKILADYEHGEVLFKVKNLERLGVVDLLFKTETINDSKLEDFAHLILGQPNAFRQQTAPMRLNLPKG
ncbi:hypothetical protein [Parvibium lacunae]|uniref:Uncharacterized protein n=1 Tax=Parvibium lacunae TaxID=1888893 RepID=A0A368L491_9BURK|nr:hypothetical protein [Parvibium lacunae]RCS58387.1 hypothetical protein DU000_06095 [Parvibium lacunae]